jgi:hypothetical protein
MNNLSEQVDVLTHLLDSVLLFRGTLLFRDEGVADNEKLRTYSRAVVAVVSAASGVLGP